MSTYLLDDMASYLVGAGLGLVLETNLFLGLMPDVPDDATALFEYSGEPPDYVYGPTTLPAMSHPHLQVISRNLTYPNARSTTEGIVRALEAIINATVNTTFYQRVERLQDPFLAHRDAKRRVFFGCNLAVTRTPS